LQTVVSSTDVVELTHELDRGRHGHEHHENGRNAAEHGENEIAA
jgi:hypothetical protein